MNYFYCYQTKLGTIFIAEDEQGITELSLITGEEETDMERDQSYKQKETGRLKEAAVEFMEYLDGSRKEFTVKLHPKGTEFQKKVWDALRKIPYGETRSYKQIAEAIGNPKACRAVGMANHNNPIMCMIPCHRVIGADKKLVGYAGGLDIKEKLLKMEKAI